MTVSADTVTLLSMKRNTKQWPEVSLFLLKSSACCGSEQSGIPPKVYMTATRPL